MEKFIVRFHILSSPSTTIKLGLYLLFIHHIWCHFFNLKHLSSNKFYRVPHRQKKTEYWVEISTCDHFNALNSIFFQRFLIGIRIDIFIKLKNDIWHCFIHPSEKLMRNFNSLKKKMSICIQGCYLTILISLLLSLSAKMLKFFCKIFIYIIVLLSEDVNHFFLENFIMSLAN